MAILESAIFWIVIAAASEIIALTPLKSNSIVQLVLSALNTMSSQEKRAKQHPRRWAMAMAALIHAPIGNEYNALHYDSKKF